MVQQVVGSIPHGRHIVISCSSQFSMTGLTKAVVCAILSWLDGTYKITLAANQKE